MQIAHAVALMIAVTGMAVLKSNMAKIFTDTASVVCVELRVVALRVRGGGGKRDTEGVAVWAWW